MLNLNNNYFTSPLPVLNISVSTDDGLQTPLDPSSYVELALPTSQPTLGRTSTRKPTKIPPTRAPTAAPWT